MKLRTKTFITVTLVSFLIFGAMQIVTVFVIQPGFINLENQDPECDLDFVPNTAREMKLDVAISNSFGFGGTNGTLAFRRYTG